MKARTFEVAGVRQKAIHEFKEMVAIFLYMAFFFCAMTTYRMLLLKDFKDPHVEYSFALINAFVFAKVILIGEYAHLGKKLEDKPLLLSSIYKAFLFSLLVIAFHYFEEGVKRVIHGENMAGTFYEMSVYLLLARSLVIFATFVPFFAFRELRRVLGESTFNRLCFSRSSQTT
jgi:hypothetical protein